MARSYENTPGETGTDITLRLATCLKPLGRLTPGRRRSQCTLEEVDRGLQLYPRKQHAPYH